MYGPYGGPREPRPREGGGPREGPRGEDLPRGGGPRELGFDGGDLGLG